MTHSIYSERRGSDRLDGRQHYLTVMADAFMLMRFEEWAEGRLDGGMPTVDDPYRAICC